MNEQAGGTTRQRIAGGRVKQLVIPVPPLPEQQRIVARIDSLSAKSKSARNHVDHIPRLAEKYKQALLASVFNEDALGQWDRGQLSGFIKDAVIGLVRSKHRQFPSVGTPYIRMNHFNMEGFWNDDDLTFVEVSQNELRRYELKEGDVLFNTRNSFEFVGKVAIWPGGRAGCVYNNNLL